MDTAVDRTAWLNDPVQRLNYAVNTIRHGARGGGGSVTRLYYFRVTRDRYREFPVRMTKQSEEYRLWLAGWAEAVALHKAGESPSAMLAEPGMIDVAREDWWGRGFVAGLFAEAGI